MDIKKIRRKKCVCKIFITNSILIGSISKIENM